jgi:hypothetical protein
MYIQTLILQVTNIINNQISVTYDNTDASTNVLIF